MSDEHIKDAICDDTTLIRRDTPAKKTVKVVGGNASTRPAARPKVNSSAGKLRLKR